MIWLILTKAPRCGFMLRTFSFYLVGKGRGKKGRRKRKGGGETIDPPRAARYHRRPRTPRGAVRITAPRSSSADAFLSPEGGKKEKGKKGREGRSKEEGTKEGA